MKRVLMILVLIGIFLASCGTPVSPAQLTATPGVKTTAEAAASPEMAIKIILGGENPHPYGGMPLMLSLTPNVAAPNTNVIITMPSDLSMITGAQAWAGDLKANQGLYLSLVVQIDQLAQPGFIQVDSVSYPKDEPKLVGSYRLYLRPTADGKVEFSQMPFKD